MNTNLFIDSCFYNSKIISIIFNTQMYITGKNSILSSNNYCISTSTETIPLNRIVKSIYSYSYNYVSFVINDKSIYSLDEKCLLHYRYIDKKEINCLTASSGIVHNVCMTIPLTSYLDKLSFNSAIAYSNTSNSITLVNNDIISYDNICLEDFYVTINDRTYIPSSFKDIDYNKIKFTFLENIIKTPTDSIILNTIKNCSSTDILGNTIKSNDSISVENNLPTKIHNVSFISYINNTLILGVTFTSPIVRYDSSDFEVYINNNYYSVIGHSSYTNKYITLTINNLYNFNYEKDTLILKTSDNNNPYTIDSRNLPISDSIGAFGNVFFSKCGTLSSNTSPSPVNFLTLNIDFNEPISNTLPQNTNFYGTLSANNDFTTLSLSINYIGILTLYGNNLVLDSSYTQYNVLIRIINNHLIILIDVNTHNFISNNSNKICYIDFTPNENLLSNTGIIPLLSYQAPIKLLKSKVYICNPDDEGSNWSLCGKTIYSDVYLYVDRSKLDRYYGLDIKPTKIIGDLYILEKQSQSVAKVNLALTNICVKNYIYVNLSNGFNPTYTSVKSTGLVFS